MDAAAVLGDFASKVPLEHRDNMAEQLRSLDFAQFRVLPIPARLADGQSDRPSGKLVRCEMKLGEQAPLPHPDASVDLCVLPFSQMAKLCAENGTPISFVGIGSSTVPPTDDWENFDAIEEVTMLGCPRGLYDEVNNLPLVRRGITATPLGTRYNGKDEFVVDMACFPGSSGSPVFVYNRDGYLDRKRNTMMVGRSRLFLVGVLHAGPMITNEGKIVLGESPRIEVASMMHLGYVIRSTALLALEERVKELAGENEP